MGVAITNAIIAAIASLANHLYFMSKSEFAMWGTLVYFAIRTMPTLIPKTPQALWTWQRDALQAYVTTKNPGGGPLNPTQPAPTVPEQTKPTP